jgi:hypothetical protein
LLFKFKLFLLIKLYSWGNPVKLLTYFQSFNIVILSIFIALAASGGARAVQINNVVDKETGLGGVDKKSGLGGDIFCGLADFDSATNKTEVPDINDVQTITPQDKLVLRSSLNKPGFFCSWSIDFFKLNQNQSLAPEEVARQGAIYLNFKEIGEDPQFLDVREWKDFGQNKKYEYKHLVERWRAENKSPAVQVINRKTNQTVSTQIKLENSYDNPIWIMALLCKRDVTALHQPRTCTRLKIDASYEKTGSNAVSEKDGTTVNAYVKINNKSIVNLRMEHDARVIEYLAIKPKDYENYLTENPYQLVLVASPFLEDLQYRPTHTLGFARQFFTGTRFGRISSYDYYDPNNIKARKPVPQELCLVPSANHKGIALFNKVYSKLYSPYCTTVPKIWGDTGVDTVATMLAEPTKIIWGVGGEIPPILSLVGLSQSFVNKYKDHAKTTTSEQQGFSGSVNIKELSSASDISKEEISSILQRKKNIAESDLVKGVANAAPDQIPTVGVAASGGGYRAMISTMGFKESLADNDLDQVLSYQVGLSGSTWYLSKLLELARESEETKALGSESGLDSKFYERLRGDLRLKPQYNGGKYIESYNFLAWPDPSTDHDILMQFYLPLIKKWAYLQDISTVDLMASALWYNLFPKTDLNSLKLSNFQNLVSQGKLPYTMMSAISKPSGEDYIWFEFSPYSTGITESKHQVDTKHLGRYFIKGKSFAGAPELSLPYLMGIWGSAMSGRVIDGIKQGMIGEDIEIPPLISGLNQGIKDVLNAEQAISQLAPKLLWMAQFQQKGPLAGPDQKKTLELIQGALDQLENAKSKAGIWFRDTLGGQKQLEEAKIKLAALSEKISANQPLTMEDIWQAYKPIQPLFKKLKSFEPDRVNFLSERLVSADKAEELQFFTGGVLGNPYFGLDIDPNEAVAGKISDFPTIELRDGGTAFNIPFPILMKEGRAVDIIIAFDALGSAAEVGTALKRACEYARDYNHDHFPYKKCLRDFSDPNFLYAMAEDPYSVISDDSDNSKQIVIYVPLKALSESTKEKILNKKTIMASSWFDALSIEEQNNILNYDPHKNDYTATMNMVYKEDQVDALANFSRLLGDLAAAEMKRIFEEKLKQKMQ